MKEEDNQFLMNSDTFAEVLVIGRKTRTNLFEMIQSKRYTYDSEKKLKCETIELISLSAR